MLRYRVVCTSRDPTLRDLTMLFSLRFGLRSLVGFFEGAVPAVATGARAPGRAYAGDAGYDLTAAEGVVLEPGGRAVVGTGVALAVPDGYAGLVLPRSGLATRFGVSLVNAPGLIDSGYRGEIKVPLINHDREEAFEVV